MDAGREVKTGRENRTLVGKVDAGREKKLVGKRTTVGKTDAGRAIAVADVATSVALESPASRQLQLTLSDCADVFWPARSWHSLCTRLDMASIGSYRDLDVWTVSMDLVDEVLRQSKRMPLEEFDLRRQIKRAALSIPSNVAEGWCRKNRPQAYQNHISIAMGSRGELDTELEVCFRNSFLNRADADAIIRLMERVRPMLVRLHDAI